MDYDDDALVEEEHEEEPEGAPEGLDQEQFDDPDGEDEAPELQARRVDPTEVQMLAQQTDTTPVKLKQTKGRHGAKQAKLAEIKNVTNDVDGVLSVLAMGTRNEPFFQLVFDERAQTEAFLDRKAYPLKFGPDKYYAHLMLAGVSRSTYEARVLPINEHGKPTGMGVASSTTNAVRALRAIVPTHHGFEKYVDSKLITKGGVNYDDTNASLTGAELYYIPAVMGMDGETCAAHLPDFLKIADTMSTAKDGVVQQVHLLAKHYNLTCTSCDHIGHKAGSQLCILNQQGFLYERKAEFARKRALDPDIRKRVRRM